MVQQTESQFQSNDDCLTSLNWLVQPAPILPLNPPTPPSTPPLGGLYQVPPLHQVQIPMAPKQIDYRVERIKPPYSYAQLISMAMQSHGGEKVVLTNIYQWIRENFSYFRGTDNSWQNSIRHNLSLNKQFIKVPRDPADKGKGSYWMLDPRTFKKDPYCIRRRNFFESHSRRPRPHVDKPQVNPAIKSFLEKTQRAQEAYKHPFSGVGEQLEDIGAQESVYSDISSGFDDFNQKLFKKDVEQYSGYIPQNDLVASSGTHQTPPTQSSIPDLSLNNGQDRVRVEYNWEGYEYHPSNVFGAQLPLQLSPGGGMILNGGIAVPPESNLSPPNSDEAEGQPSLDLRIPTPDWWSSQVTTASLLSPTGSGIYSGQNPLARVFENLSGSGTSTNSEIFPGERSSNAGHPWEDKGLSQSNGTESGLFDLDYAHSSPQINGEAATDGYNGSNVPATPGSCEFVDVETTDGSNP